MTATVVREAQDAENVAALETVVIDPPAMS